MCDYRESTYRRTKAPEGSSCKWCEKEFRTGEQTRMYFDPSLHPYCDPPNWVGNLICWNGESCARREKAKFGKFRYIID